MLLIHMISPIWLNPEMNTLHDESICGAEKRDRRILSTDAQNVLTTLRTQECLLVHSRNVM